MNMPQRRTLQCAALATAMFCGASFAQAKELTNASNFLSTDIVMMGIIVIGVVAYFFDLLMRWRERHLVPCKGRM